MPLKPHDLYVVLKLIASGSRRPPYATLAKQLGMSASEVHASVKRAQNSGLLQGPDSDARANIPAVEEFMIHGLRYAFPPSVDRSPAAYPHLTQRPR